MSLYIFRLDSLRSETFKCTFVCICLVVCCEYIYPMFGKYVVLCSSEDEHSFPDITWISYIVLTFGLVLNHCALFLSSLILCRWSVNAPGSSAWRPRRGGVLEYALFYDRSLIVSRYDNGYHQTMLPCVILSPWWWYDPPVAIMAQARNKRIQAHPMFTWSRSVVFS